MIKAKNAPPEELFCGKTLFHTYRDNTFKVRQLGSQNTYPDPLPGAPGRKEGLFPRRRGFSAISRYGKHII
jgi:hypothetical protein